MWGASILIYLPYPWFLYLQEVCETDLLDTVAYLYKIMNANLNIMLSLNKPRPKLVERLKLKIALFQIVFSRYSV